MKKYFSKFAERFVGVMSSHNFFRELGLLDLRGVNFRGTKLDGQNLQKAKMQSSNLSDCSLKGAKLTKANLRDANLRYADLEDTDLRGANLIGADLSYVENWETAKFDDCTISENTVLPFPEKVIENMNIKLQKEG